MTAHAACFLPSQYKKQNPPLKIMNGNDGHGLKLFIILLDMAFGRSLSACQSNQVSVKTTRIHGCIYMVKVVIPAARFDTSQ